MDFVHFILRKNMCLGLNFESNLCNDGALQFCKGPFIYHLVADLGQCLLGWLWVLFELKCVIHLLSNICCVMQF